MCRWLGYIGPPTTPNQYLYEDRFSLIEQSHTARKSKSVVNGDGFGLGWYAEQAEPGLFRDILPAWSDENLKSLATHIKSGLFFAHVRAATSTSTNRTNCHPFRHDNSLFVHNGQIGGYQTVRRKVEALIHDDLYTERLGTTDSEALFLGLKSLMKGSQPFCESTQELIHLVVNMMRSHNITEPFRYTSAYSEGDKIYAVRYSSDKLAPSLFYSKIEGGWLLVSEPLDNQLNHWQLVPANHTIELCRHSAEPVIKAL